MQQQKRDNVDDIEMSLLEHQLALFPHLEDSVPPEVRHLVVMHLNLIHTVKVPVITAGILHTVGKFSILKNL